MWGETSEKQAAASCKIFEVNYSSSKTIFLSPVSKWFFKVTTMLRGGLILAPSYILYHKPNLSLFPDAGKKNRIRDAAKEEN